MEDAYKLYEDLRSETEYLRKKQQRKGVEYKMRESPGGKAERGSNLLTRALQRPSDLAGTSTSPRKKKDEPSPKGAKAGEQQEASADGTVTLKIDLDEYDPKALAEKEMRELEKTVASAREEASELHHSLSRLQRQRDDLHSELIKLQYEDDIEVEREEGMRQIAAEKARGEDMRRQLDETEAYKLTLEYMLARCKRTKIDSTAVQKAFEDALEVHNQELKMKKQLLESVLKSRDNDVQELQKMQAEIKKQLSDYDRKLQSRQQEVKVRQEKARWRLAKLEHDMSLAAQAGGGLSPEEEKLLIEQAKTMSAEASEVRQAKVKAQMEAETAESEFQRLRFAAGVVADYSARADPATLLAAHRAANRNQAVNAEPNGADEEAVAAAERDELAPFVQPDPDAIIQRLAQLEVEIHQVDEQVADYSARLKALQSRHAQLKAIKQPKARDSRDEEETDVLNLDRLKKRATDAKRGLDVARQELREVEQTKLQLQQSVGLLAAKLDRILAPLPEMPECDHPGILEDEASITKLMETDSASLPSSWCAQLHEKLLYAVGRLHMLLRVTDINEAASAYHEAKEWLAASVAPMVASPPRRGLGSPARGPGGRGGLAGLLEAAAAEEAAGGAPVEGADRDRAMSSFDLPALAIPADSVRPGSGSGFRATSAGSGAAGAAGLAASSTGSGMRLMRKATLTGGPASEDKDDIDAAVDTLVTPNEFSVRVRPHSGAAISTAAKKTSLAFLQANAAAHHATPAQQAKALAEAAALFEKAITEGPARSGGGGEGGDEAAAGSSSASVRSGTAGRRMSRSGASVSNAHAGGSSAESTDGRSVRRGSVSQGGGGGGAGVPRPRPRDLHKMLAAALQMAGDEVDEFLIAPQQRREAEEVVTRDQLKRITKVNIRQMQRERAAAAAAAAGGKGSGAGEAESP